MSVEHYWLNANKEAIHGLAGLSTRSFTLSGGKRWTLHLAGAGCVQEGGPGTILSMVGV